MPLKFDFQIGAPPRAQGFTISAPVWHEDYSICEVSIDGLPARPIQGEDPLNALQNAIQFVEAYVAAAAGAGESVKWVNGMTYGAR